MQNSLEFPTAGQPADRLSARYLPAVDAEALLRAVIEREFPGRIALVSSFGAESVVLLHLVSRIDRALPVLFLNTGKLFAETLQYRHKVAERLQLANIREITYDAAQIAAIDPEGDLWAHNPNRCCYLRKVRPLDRALEGYDAWITGRKQFQGGQRGALPVFEEAEGRIKVNPLALWPREKLQAYIDAHDLPRHPLLAKGYASIGCTHCTVPAGARSGRWQGTNKTECGIHLPRAAVETLASDSVTG